MPGNTFDRAEGSYPPIANGLALDWLAGEGMEALEVNGEGAAPGPVEVRCLRFEDGRGEAVELGGSICDW
jgi:hypothetical protein